MNQSLANARGSVLEIVHLRAALYAKIRAFFAKKNIAEAETPLLCQHTVTDFHIDSFSVSDRFLQTSPEYAMKRLLASGSGSIYQICKAFRQGESGHQHNPEFTMLEWYHVGFDHHALMHEVDELLQFILYTSPSEKISYQDLFLKNVNVDPFKTNLDTLKKIIVEKKIAINLDNVDFDGALQILLTHVIEPNLGLEKPLFLYDFPVSQCALAKIRDDDFPVAERFELYLNGMEIANGFHELTNAREQEKRFQQDQIKRRHHQKFVPAIDYRLIATLQAGLPECAGVAMGLDRLLMYLVKSKRMQDVICFPWEVA